MKLFDHAAEVVVAAVECTWCGAQPGDDCYEKDLRRDPSPHAQRWRDYWNATHERRDHVAVYPAQWRRPKVEVP